jgi:hypothetical protein
MFGSDSRLCPRHNAAGPSTYTAVNSERGLPRLLWAQGDIEVRLGSWI